VHGPVHDNGLTHDQGEQSPARACATDESLGNVGSASPAATDASAWRDPRPHANAIDR
jgi:hypothetical protein